MLPPPLASVLPEAARSTHSMLDIFGTLDHVPLQCQLDEPVPSPLQAYRPEISAAIEVLVGYHLDNTKCQKDKLVGDKNWTE